MRAWYVLAWNLIFRSSIKRVYITFVEVNASMCNSKMLTDYVIQFMMKSLEYSNLFDQICKYKRLRIVSMRLNIKEPPWTAPKSYQRGGRFVNTLGQSAGKSVFRIQGRGKCSIRTSAVDARLIYPINRKCGIRVMKNCVRSQSSNVILCRIVKTLKHFAVIHFHLFTYTFFS